MGNFSSTTGVVTLIMMLMSRGIFNKFGWGKNFIFQDFYFSQFFSPYFFIIFFSNVLTITFYFLHVVGVAALITPITLLITGAMFFSLNLFPAFFAPITAKIGTTPLMLAVMVGAAQNILSKGAKYALFDPCKEMAYIPLDAESKTKGKAAVDVIGNPLGKSGGSFLQQILIGVFGSLSASTPYLGGILGVSYK
jgi:AAA family ATP:ADP antiporter